jgi:hypothetical protein
MTEKINLHGAAANIKWIRCRKFLLDPSLRLVGYFQKFVRIAHYANLFLMKMFFLRKNLDY